MSYFCPECGVQTPQDCIVAFGSCARCWIPKERTLEEIDKLKRNWREDPCWDIETTEGFENHSEDLLVYRVEMESHWAEQLTRWPMWESVNPRPGPLVTRLPVVGGWLVKTSQGIYKTENEDDGVMLSTCFIPDPHHAWKVGTVGDYTENRPTERKTDISEETEVENMRRKIQERFKA